MISLGGAQFQTAAQSDRNAVFVHSALAEQQQLPKSAANTTNDRYQGALPTRRFAQADRQLSA
jgi:hypothetical protein